MPKSLSLHAVCLHSLEDLRIRASMASVMISYTLHFSDILGVSKSSGSHDHTSN